MVQAILYKIKNGFNKEIINSLWYKTIGVYSNVVYMSNNFANRYNLFLIPIWFVTALLLIDLTFKEMVNINYSKYVQPCIAMMAGCTIAVLVCWSYLGWTSLSNNWDKEDIRGATEKWISETGYETDTIIFAPARSGFSYYATHSSVYNDSLLEKVVFQGKEIGEADSSAVTEWVNSVYEGNWPSSLYIIASHLSDSASIHNLVNTFTNAGYTATDIFNANGAQLIYLKK